MSQHPKDRFNLKSPPATSGSDADKTQLYCESLVIRDSGMADIHEQRNARVSTDDLNTLVEDPSTQNADLFATVEPTATKNSAQRFVLLRELNKGNLGVVSVALDTELNREIALKHIRGDRAECESFRSSFVREAEVTGKLEHPGVVPVYSFGKGTNDRLYYAMRLIRGIDLRNAIEIFHQAVQLGQAPYNGKELRELVRNLISVCHTMAYAHSRGVLHRDLKPANIMLGAYGETLVVDWGLSKATGQTSADAEIERITVHDVRSVEKPLETTKSNTSETVDGSIIGSPAYASPEQLTGNLAAIDHRSDIYSLGVILFEILTGSIPLRVASLEELIAKVRAGLVPGPRQVTECVPKPIDAICRRAMSLRPEDRYQSAKELRIELENWLYDQPISAYDESWLERLFRWMRNHQALVRAAAISLVVVTCVSVLAATMINAARRSQATALRNEEQARREATEALRNEERSRQEATELYQLARTTTDTLLSTTSDRLAEIPDATDLRKELLSKAALAYERMAEHRSMDLGLRRETVNSQLELASVQRKLDQSPAAIATLKKSVTALDELVKSGASNEGDYAALAEALIELSRVHSDVREHEAAMKAVVRALSELDQFTGKPACAPIYWLLRGKALIQRGLVEYDRDLEQGREDFLSAKDTNRAAIVSLRKGIEAVVEPDLTIELRHQLARANLNQAYLLSDPKEVLPLLEEALQNLEWCIERNPTSSELNQDLAKVHNNLADCSLNDQGDLEAAEKFYQRSLRFFSKLSQQHPLVVEYKNGLVLARLGSGYVAFKRGQNDVALAHYEAANMLADELIAQNSVRITFRTTAALAKHALAEHLTDIRPSEALVHLKAAAELLPTTGQTSSQITHDILKSQLDLANLALCRKDLDGTAAAGLANRLEKFVDSTAGLRTWKSLYNSACYISMACEVLYQSDASSNTSSKVIDRAATAAIDRLRQVISHDKEHWNTVKQDKELEFLRKTYVDQFERLMP